MQNSEIFAKEVSCFESVGNKISSAFFAKKLHHAIILVGPKSIGKASFAKNLAIELLKSSPKDGNNGAENNFVNTNQHPDLKIIVAEGLSNTIKVNQIRGEGGDKDDSLIYFLNQTPSIASCKFAIIDAIDEANINASNSLLKTLEEPLPNNFLVLIAHNESKILATIKSRCLLIRMPIIDNETFLKTLSLKRPNINRKDLDLLKEITANALGDAIENYQEYPKIYGYLIEDLVVGIISAKLLEKTTNKDFNLDNVAKLVNFLFSRMLFFYECNSKLIKFNSYQQEILLFIKISSRQNLQQIFANISKINKIFADTKRLNLDRRLAIINIFNLINS
jgi:DNA polymerase III delta prime subunit